MNSTTLDHVFLCILLDFRYHVKPRPRPFIHPYLYECCLCMRTDSAPQMLGQLANSKTMAEGVAMLCLSLRRSIQHATLERTDKRALDHSLPNVRVYTSAMTGLVAWSLHHIVEDS